MARAGLWEGRDELRNVIAKAPLPELKATGAFPRVAERPADVSQVAVGAMNQRVLGQEDAVTASGADGRSRIFDQLRGVAVSLEE